MTSKRTCPLLFPALALGFALAVAAAPAQGSGGRTLRLSYNAVNDRYRTAVATVYAEIGLRVEWVMMPGERGLVSVRDGIVDGDLGRVEEALVGYPDLVRCTESIMDVYLEAWAAPERHLVVGSARDLSRYRLVLVRGAIQAEAFARAQGLSVESVSDVETLARMIFSGREDLAILPSSIDLGPYGLVRVNRRLATSHAYLVLNARHADLVPRLDAVIRAMREDGRLGRLFAFK